MKNCILIVSLLIPFSLFAQVDNKIEPTRMSPITHFETTPQQIALNTAFQAIEYDFTVFQKWNSEPLPRRMNPIIFPLIEMPDPILLSLHQELKRSSASIPKE